MPTQKEKHNTCFAQHSEHRHNNKQRLTRRDTAVQGSWRTYTRRQQALLQRCAAPVYSQRITALFQHYTTSSRQIYCVYSTWLAESEQTQLATAITYYKMWLTAARELTFWCFTNRIIIIIISIRHGKSNSHWTSRSSAREMCLQQPAEIQVHNHMWRGRLFQRRWQQLWMINRPGLFNLASCMQQCLTMKFIDASSKNKLTIIHQVRRG